MSEEIEKEAAIEATKKEKKYSLNWMSYFNGYKDAMLRTKGRNNIVKTEPPHIINEEMDIDN